MEASTSNGGHEPRISKAALCAHLGCSERYIEKRAKEGMPYVKVARHPRYLVSEVEAWLERHGHLTIHGDVADLR
jgi:hypothetical protein